jgi:anaerobic selenocysteine-containing dehydrogenase
MVSGGVRALYAIGANPAAVPANAQALSKLEFLVVQDLFLTETARLAHVVLPATSFAEADGTYTNLERRVQRAPQAVKRVGDSEVDWAILQRLAGLWLSGDVAPSEAAAQAERVAAGYVMPPSAPPRTRVRSGARLAPWNYRSAGEVLDEIARAVPAYTGLSWKSLGDAGIQWPADAVGATTPSAAPVEVAPVAARPGGGYWLVSGPLLWDHGTFMRYGAPQLRDLAPAPFVALNRADIQAAGLSENEEVVVRAGHTRLLLVLRADPAVAPGTAWIPYELDGRPAETLGAGRGEPVIVTVR